MKDFASFSGSDGKKDEFMKEAERISKQYEGKSENDLLKAIYAQALEGKRNGTLTNEQIDEFVKKISPMLDGAKRKRLQKLVAELKKM